MDHSKQQISKLVEIFTANLEQYNNPNYKEAHVRKEFIDKFFTALGWDVNNDEGRSEKYKEVINEDAIKIGGRTKAPDYAFRIGGAKVFYVEAKKPSLNIKDNPEPAYQLRRYAWNSDIPLSVLTDFQEFAVYDCTIKPSPNDNPFVGRLLYFNYKDYFVKFDKIWNIFSKESVLKGSFDRYAQKSKTKRGSSQVDSEFLKQIDKWRNILAMNIANKNVALSAYTLNHCVQIILNRLLFLRICEDKSIEPYESLKEISSQKDKVYKKLLQYFEYSDSKYNSGIFEVGKDDVTTRLQLDDAILNDIIQELYYPRSPYDFSVISIEILGRVYEKFLSKLVSLTKSHKIKIEVKPLIRKRGGVYYTPEYVVDYIVSNTVGRFINSRSHDEIRKIKILDLACGSGTFLVRAYSHLLDYYLSYYSANPKKFKNEIYQIREGRWHLTTEVRKRILLDNIFGIDIDPQAVEMTKLSLLLKVLENETQESVNQQLKLFQERALPNIDNNIKCGNSLVDSSYFSSLLQPFDQQAVLAVNPFDWEHSVNGFGRIMKDGGFDIIIGNPPYVKEDVYREIFEAVELTNMSKYYQGKMDYWYFFTCRSLDKLKKGGFHSFIAHNNWVTSYGASILRNKVLDETRLISFFDFNEYMVFKDANIQTMIFVLQKDDVNKPYNCDHFKIINRKITKEQLRNFFIQGETMDSVQQSIITMDNKLLKNKTISLVSKTEEEITDWISSKGNFHLQDKEIGNGIDVLQDFVKKSHLEKLNDALIHKSDGIFVLTTEELKRKNFNDYEMKKIKPYYTTDQLKEYYGDSKNKFWIIYADQHVRSNIDLYPNIKTHLDKFRRILTSAFKPYGLHRPREQRFFEGEKILILRKTMNMSCTYVDFPCYVSRAFMIAKPIHINLKYLTGLLNSKLINYWVYYKGKRQGEQLQVDKYPINAIPIYVPGQGNQHKREVVESMVKIVEDVTKGYSIMKNVTEHEKIILTNNIEILKNKIDELVYDLYDMSQTYVMIIENWFNNRSHLLDKNVYPEFSVPNS